MNSSATSSKRASAKPIQQDDGYLRRVWAARYFWWQLAMSDVRARYRRSLLGLMWAVLVPMLMTALLTFVIGKVFQSPAKNLAPFIFSGLVVWEFLVSTAVMGCGCLINGAPYIKQFRHPLAIYALRCVVVALVNLILGLFGLAVYVALARTENLGVFVLGALFAIPFYALVAWPISIIASFLNSRFGDTQQMIGILLQMLYFASPVFIEPEFFRNGGLTSLVDRNPIYHLLNLVRAPALSGTFAPMESFAYATALAVLLWVVAARMIAKQESRMIFYL